MKTYPAILKSKTESDTRIMLAYDKHQSTCVSDDRFDFYCGFNFDASDAWQNITREYLSNTYGKVESKEHADFIVKLAKENDLIANDEYSSEYCYFSFSEDELLFFEGEFYASCEGEKLITIPLPPKEEKGAMNNNGDNLMFGGEDKRKEWPCVGDEVAFPSGKGVLVVGNPDISGVIIVKSTDVDSIDEYKKVSLNALKKPLTPEQHLRDKLIAAMDNSSTAFTYAECVAKAIINGEIEGLTYKPQ